MCYRGKAKMSSLCALSVSVLRKKEEAVVVVAAGGPRAVAAALRDLSPSQKRRELNELAAAVLDAEETQRKAFGGIPLRVLRAACCKLALVFLVLALGVLVPLVAIAASSQPSTTVARGARSAPLLAVNEACDVATLEVVVGDVDAAAMVHADSSSSSSSSSSGVPLSAALIPAGSADSTKAHQDDADRADRDASLAARQSDVGPADDDAHAGRADKTSSGTSARASADATTDRPVDSASCATGPAGHTPVSDCAAEAEGDKRSDCHESSDSAAAADGAEDAADGQSGTGHEGHEDHEDHEGPQDPESSSGEDAVMGLTDSDTAEHSPDSGFSEGLPDSQHTDLSAVPAGSSAGDDVPDDAATPEDGERQDGEVPDAPAIPVVADIRLAGAAERAAGARQGQLASAMAANERYVGRLRQTSLFAREAARRRLLPRTPLQSLLHRLGRQQPGARDRDRRDREARAGMAAMADALDALAEAHGALGARLRAAFEGRAWADARDASLWAALASLRSGPATRAYAHYAAHLPRWSALMAQLRAASSPFRGLCASALGPRDASVTPEAVALGPLRHLEQLSLLGPFANAPVLAYAPLAGAAAETEARELRAWALRLTQRVADIPSSAVVTTNQWTRFDAVTLNFNLLRPQLAVLHYNAGCNLDKKETHMVTRLVVDGEVLPGSATVNGNVLWHTNTVSVPVDLGTGNHVVELWVEETPKAKKQKMAHMIWDLARKEDTGLSPTAHDLWEVRVHQHQLQLRSDVRAEIDSPLATACRFFNTLCCALGTVTLLCLCFSAMFGAFFDLLDDASRQQQQEGPLQAQQGSGSDVVASALTSVRALASAVLAVVALPYAVHLTASIAEGRGIYPIRRRLFPRTWVSRALNAAYALLTVPGSLLAPLCARGLYAAYAPADALQYAVIWNASVHGAMILLFLASDMGLLALWLLVPECALAFAGLPPKKAIFAAIESYQLCLNTTAVPGDQTSILAGPVGLGVPRSGLLQAAEVVLSVVLLTSFAAFCLVRGPALLPLLFGVLWMADLALDLSLQGTAVRECSSARRHRGLGLAADDGRWAQLDLALAVHKWARVALAALAVSALAQILWQRCLLAWVVTALVAVHAAVLASSARADMHPGSTYWEANRRVFEAVMAYGGFKAARLLQRVLARPTSLGSRCMTLCLLAGAVAGTALFLALSLWPVLARLRRPRGRPEERRAQERQRRRLVERSVRFQGLFVLTGHVGLVVALASVVVALFGVFLGASVTRAESHDYGDSAAASGAAVAPELPELPVCRLRFTRQNLTVVDVGLLITASYKAPRTAQAMLARWFGPAWRVAGPGGASDATHFVQFYEFVSRDNATCVLSIRGTDNLHDMLRDADIWLHSALLRALQVVIPGSPALPHSIMRSMVDWSAPSFLKKYHYEPLERWLAEHPCADRVFIGHSLGGGLAQIASVKGQGPSVAFSPPGMLLTSAKFRVPKGEVHRRMEHWSVAVIPERDVVPMMDVQRGLVQHIPCRSANPLDCHSSVRTTCYLLKSCGDPYGRSITPPPLC
eukprot:m51a1_g3676 hypothetical protein (1542) ;mRNA; r:287622-302325